MAPAMAARGTSFRLLRRVAVGTVATAAAVFVVLLGLDSGGRPVSTLILAREITGRSVTRTVVPLDAVAPILVATVVASEDARFCRNAGVDWGALHGVIEAGGAEGPARGASTITMQTAKNLFLWPGRSTIRKGLEIAIALGLGTVWTKAHTMEVYLNVAEWGDGIFGIEAAARRYFGKPAARLDARDAALLATALPNPILRDPLHPRPFQRRLAAGLMVRARRSAEWLDCLPGVAKRLGSSRSPGRDQPDE